MPRGGKTYFFFLAVFFLAVVFLAAFFFVFFFVLTAALAIFLFLKSYRLFTNWFLTSNRFSRTFTCSGICARSLTANR